MFHIINHRFHANIPLIRAYPSWLQHLMSHTSPCHLHTPPPPILMNSPFTGQMGLRNVTLSRTIAHRSLVVRCSSPAPENFCDLQKSCVLQKIVKKLQKKVVICRKMLQDCRKKVVVCRKKLQVVEKSYDLQKKVVVFREKLQVVEKICDLQK